MKPAEPPPKEHQRIMAARPPRTSANTQASTASTDGGMGQLLLLIADLEANQQTNALKLLNNYLTTMTTTMQAADAATTVTILEQLRTGHRAEAIELLESRLDVSLLGLGSSVGATPRTERQPASLRTLQRAKEYRAEFPRKTGNTNVDSAVRQAWNLTDEHK